MPLRAFSPIAMVHAALQAPRHLKRALGRALRRSAKTSCVAGEHATARPGTNP